MGRPTPQVSWPQGLSRPVHSRWAALMANPQCKGCWVPGGCWKCDTASGVNANGQVCAQRWGGSQASFGARPGKFPSERRGRGKDLGHEQPQPQGWVCSTRHPPLQEAGTTQRERDSRDMGQRASTFPSIKREQGLWPPGLHAYGSTWNLLPGRLPERTNPSISTPS